jgi:hypothetical protein
MFLGIQYFKISIIGGLQMNFNDIVEQINERQKILHNLNEIIKGLRKAIEIHEAANRTLFQSSFTSLIYNTNNAVTNAAALVNTSKNSVTGIQDELICIDFIELGMILADLINIDPSDMLTNNFVKQVRDNYKVIHSFKGLKDPNRIVQEYQEAIFSVRTIVNEYDKIGEFSSYINYINKKLSLNAEDIFKIRFLNENTEIDAVNESFNSLNAVYEQLCRVTKISATE